ncbi:SDR family oxidoreductase [Fulvivirga sp. M361]|uniref:SDR family NAD(P)-dependent oxidoreductase n=1 Tax=Fulvivirga sp. M361 TaxID=2594266 RepID=UPI00117A38A7|nr:SDR family oxidoreductase [Fulvivirga sp. M361]TRX50033.1 SDR family oxidoreductase [Fulvivirga sp. M361]
MRRLKDKIAVVTGAAEGIGLAISQMFALEGCKVAMCDINLSKCETESSLINKKGGETIPFECSVDNSSQMENVVKAVMNSFKQIDVLVNNAAIAVQGNIVEMPEEDWDTLMNVNLKGVFIGIKTVLPHMLKKRSGSIISLSSLQASRSWNDWTAYAAAKGGINAMTVQLAGQFGNQNVRFNTISPGAINTPMNERRQKEEGESFLKASIDQAAMLRLGTTEEVAQTAVFLASDESRFITGEDIKVDGGLSALPRYIEN